VLRPEEPRFQLLAEAIAVAPDVHRRWHNKAAIAVATKLGRLIWAVRHRNIDFHSTPATV
jgi:hypothetical protein